MPEGKLIVLRSKMHDMALSIDGNNATSGQRVTVHPYQTGNNCQLWFENHILGTIHSAANENLVIDIHDGQVVVRDYKDGDKDQQWAFSGDKIAKKHDGHVLDISNLDTSPGAKLCEWSYNGGHNQHWKIEHLQAKYFHIVSKLNGKVVDVARGNRDPGAKLCTWDKHNGNSDNQLFYEDKTLNIRSKLNDFVFHASGEGATVELQPAQDGNASRTWYRSGLKVVNKANPNLCLDIKGGRHSAGADVIEYKYEGHNNQHWDFVLI